MKWFCGYRGQGIWWFRIFGYGIKAKNTRIDPPNFFDDYRYVKLFEIGNWRFGILKPW